MVEEIDFSDNELHGILPTEFGWFEELETLSLGGNLLSGTIPSELGSILTLQNLYLHANQFYQPLEDICSIENGVFVVWADCGDDPPKVSCSTCCTRCFGADSEFIPYEVMTYFPTANPTKAPVGNNAPGMPENTELKEFLLGHMNGFEGSLDNTNSPQYEAYLWLANTKGFEDWDEEQRLQRFGLVSFYLSTRPDFDWKTSNRWKTHENECNWYGIQCADNRTVSEITLTHNRMSGSIPPEIALVGLEGKLVKLDLSGNNIRGKVPAQIGTLKNLEILDLKSNDFTGNIPSELGHLLKLTMLHLHANEFTGEMPPEVCMLRSEHFLNDLSADCDPDDPFDEVSCNKDTCCTECF